jgi:7-keto-8-aminopelargonate synthetase-like enzyme
LIFFRVDWSQLYDKDHYKNQESIYKRLRPTLLSNTLVVPTPKIRGHVRDLAANDYFGLKQQVEAFHRTTRKSNDIFERPARPNQIDRSIIHDLILLFLNFDVKG